MKSVLVSDGPRPRSIRVGMFAKQFNDKSRLEYGRDHFAGRMSPLTGHPVSHLCVWLGVGAPGAMDGSIVVPMMSRTRLRPSSAIPKTRG